MKYFARFAAFILVVSLIVFLADNYDRYANRAEATTNSIQTMDYHPTHTDLELMRYAFTKHIQAPHVANVVGEIETVDADHLVFLCGTVNSPDLKRNVPFRGLLVRFQDHKDTFSIVDFAPNDSVKEARIVKLCERLYQQ